MSMTSRTEYSTQTPKKSTLFSGQYLHNHWTLDIGVLGYIGIVWPKEHSPEVWSVPPGTPCILEENLKVFLWKCQLDLWKHTDYQGKLRFKTCKIQVSLCLDNSVAIKRCRVWVSPSCPQLPLESDTRAGESPTEFKADLLRYMAFYQLPALQEWMSRLRKADFSAIK